MANHIDVVYYINLDHRNDRKKEFLREMEKYGFNNVVRVSAIYDKDHGHLGCVKSHINTLEMFMKSNYKNCMICEDDLEFVCNPLPALNRFFDNKIRFDVCMLSGNVFDARPIDNYDFIKKVYCVTTASGYIITKQFASVLLENFRESSILLEKSFHEGTPENPYDHYSAIDQYWCRIQGNSNWFIFEPKLGKQRMSYSDIDKRVKDMNL